MCGAEAVIILRLDKYDSFILFLNTGNCETGAAHNVRTCFAIACIETKRKELPWNNIKPAHSICVPPPIGNLEDITYRVLRTLKEVDLIAAEDTRNSIRLLNHFEIKTPMTSYHEYNKIDKAYQLVAKMREGKNIALITDAGTPGISDPGEDIVRICYEEGIPVTSLPGAAACITALTMSGLPTRRFVFEAFLPKDKKEHQAVLEE